MLEDVSYGPQKPNRVQLNKKLVKKPEKKEEND